MLHPRMKTKSMKMKSQQVCWKAVSIVLICFGFVVYLNWEIVKSPVPSVYFNAIVTKEYIQLVPNVENLSSLEEHIMITKTYRYEDKQYDLRIIAIVYNRAKSLLRLLTSLNEADYGSDEVKLEVWIDRAVDGTVDPLTLQTAESFNFKHGKYSVIQHPQHVGIYGQWLTTWRPKLNSSEIAVILEDDLTVSPYFYKYLKLVHEKYDSHPEVNGYALQGVSIKHHVMDQTLLEASKENLVYLYPVLGTWGFSPCRDKWMKFLDWFSSAHKDRHFQPYVPNNIVTKWYQTFQTRGQSQGLWSIWHIYYAWRNKQYTLYSNFGGHVGLTVNWREAGLHFVASESRPSNPPLKTWLEEYDNLPDNPIHLDILGHKVKR